MTIGIPDAGMMGDSPTSIPIKSIGLMRSLLFYSHVIFLFPQKSPSIFLSIF